MIDFINILLESSSFKIFYKNPVEFHNIKKNFRKFSTFFAILRNVYTKTS